MKTRKELLIRLDQINEEITNLQDRITKLVKEENVILNTLNDDEIQEFEKLLNYYESCSKPVKNRFVEYIIDTDNNVDLYL